MIPYSMFFGFFGVYQKSTFCINFTSHFNLSIYQPVKIFRTKQFGLGIEHSIAILFAITYRI